MRLAAGVAVVVILLGIAIGGSYALSLYAINKSQHQWCDTLTLLTQNANPPTSSGKEFYHKLHLLEQHFGC